jgi:membrane-associated protease RseP (regulator of RpoE activity)
MSNKTLCVAFFVLSALCVSTLNAQTKATVKIKKSENGKTTEQVYNIELEEGEDIQKALAELGVLDEKGNLSPNEHFEIKINRFYEGQNTHSLPNLNPLTTPPSSTVKEIRPFLGILLKDTDSVLEINQVEPGGAADKAGIRKGDILTKVNDQTIETYAQFSKAIQSKKIGDKITIHVLRNRKSKKFKATLGQKLMEVQAPSGQSFNSYLDANGHIPVFNFRFGPDSITILGPSDDTLKIGQPFAWNNGEMIVKETAYLGVTPYSDSIDVLDEQGVKINVEPQTPAGAMGMQSGDVITSFNGIAIHSFQQLADIVASTQPEQVVDITVLRDGKQKNLTGAVGKRNCSKFDDFRIFHDFKGMDEIGNFFYNYEFDMNLEDIERHMDELLNSLTEEQNGIEQERRRLEEKFSHLNNTVYSIQIDDLSSEDASRLNNSASKGWSAKDDLVLESISYLPNTFTGKIQLRFETSNAGKARIELTDAEGNTVFLEERMLSDKQYSNAIDLSELSSGTYYLRITQNGRSHSKKIEKK